MPVFGIALGGALGAVARHYVTIWSQAYLARGVLHGFPVGTLLVNIVGSFLLAMVLMLSTQGILPSALRLAIGTGFIGAFTTFSTFELDAHLLFEQGHHLRAAVYVLANLILGYGAILLARYLLADRSV